MSTHLRTQSLAIVMLVVGACSGPTEGASPNIPEVPVPAETVGRLELTFDTRESFAGLSTQMRIRAWSASGTRVSSSLAVVTSWNPSVATVDGVQSVQVVQPNGQSIGEAVAFLGLRVAGSAVIRVRLGEFTDSTVVTVRPLPLASNALVVDSFTVVEYRATCASCNILGYAPLLKLREPTGVSLVHVVAVEFSIPGMTTGFCTAEGVQFTPGLSAQLNYIDPIYYMNELAFFTNAAPVPDGMARARVITRDAGGQYGLIEASAPIQRMVSSPTFPASSFQGVSWSCNSRWPG